MNSTGIISREESLRIYANQLRKSALEKRATELNSSSAEKRAAIMAEIEREIKEQVQLQSAWADASIQSRAMKTSANCPACNGKISLWDGMKALTPFHLRCPHCTAKLRMQIRGFWWLCLAICGLAAGLACGWTAAWRAFGRPGFVIAFLSFLAIWVVVEFVTSVTLFTYGTITKRDR